MARFSQVVAGARARKRIKLPLPGAHVDPETGEWIPPQGRPLPELDVRALREDEHDEVLAQALAYARRKGVAAPEDGEALYERGKILYTLAIACLDPESTADAPAPFFDGGVEQIVGSEIMTPEVVGYLYLQQQLHQDDVSPLKKDMTPAEFMSAAVTTAKGSMSFFVNSRPGMQWSFLRILASLHVDSLGRSSPSSSSSEPPETTNE